jgi:uncharacterized DUF497 family protein
MVYTEIDFVWDKIKSEQNKIKHGVDFREAIEIFDDPFAILSIDLKHYSKEIRHQIIGSANSKVLMVVFTRRGTPIRIRLISARIASSKERLFYEKNKWI